MKKLEELHLEEYLKEREDYLKERIEDLIENEYPNLLELTPSQMLDVAKKLCWDAQSHYETCIRLEDSADAIEQLAKILKKKESGR